MDSLFAVKQELDQLDRAIKAETTACAQIRRAAAEARAANEQLRAELLRAMQRAYAARDECGDLESLIGCLRQQKEAHTGRRDALQVRVLVAALVDDWRGNKQPDL